MFLFKHMAKILVHSRNLIQYEAGGAQSTMGHGQPLIRSPGCLIGAPGSLAG